MRPAIRILHAECRSAAAPLLWSRMRRREPVAGVNSVNKMLCGTSGFLPEFKRPALAKERRWREIR